MPVEFVFPVPKLPPDDQAVPLYSSVTFDLTGTASHPPKLRPAVCVPALATSFLAVPKLPPDDQAVPLYSSVIFDASLDT